MRALASLLVIAGTTQAGQLNSGLTHQLVWSPNYSDITVNVALPPYAEQAFRPVTGVMIHWQLGEVALSPNVTNTSSETRSLGLYPIVTLDFTAPGATEHHVVNMASFEPLFKLGAGDTFFAYTTGVHDYVGFDTPVDPVPNPTFTITAHLDLNLNPGLEVTGNEGWVFEVFARAEYTFAGVAPEPGTLATVAAGLLFIGLMAAVRRIR